MLRFISNTCRNIAYFVYISRLTTVVLSCVAELRFKWDIAPTATFFIAF